MLHAPLELESTNCYNLEGPPPTPTTRTLNVGDSCVYTIKYSSAESANQTTLPFTYNNGIDSQTSDVAVDWVKTTTYAYIAGGTDSSNWPTVFGVINRCNISESGLPIECKIESGAESGKSTVIHNNKTFKYQQLEFKNIAGVKYLYSAAGYGVAKCSLDNNGHITSCIQAITDNTFDKSDISYFTIAKVGTKEFLYMSDMDSGNLYYCSFNSVSGMADNCMELDTGDSPAGLASIDLNGNTYLVTNYYNSGTLSKVAGIGKMYPINADTGEPDIANAINSGIERSRPLSINTVNNIKNAYTSQWWTELIINPFTPSDRLSVATGCNFSTQTESFGNCVNTTLDANDELNRAEQIGVLQNYYGNTYVYYGMNGNPRNKMYICSTSSITGAIISCTLQTITNEIQTSPQAYGSAFASF